jgi:hypothetical protein
MIEIIKTPGPLADRLPVFATEAFLAARSPEYGWFVTDSFALPFIVERRLCFSRLIFTTETIYLTDAANAEAEASFLEEVVRTSERHVNVDFIATAQANAVFRVVPAGSEHIEWGSYVVDLTPSEADILNSFHSKHRNVIRNAAKNGVTIATTDDCGLVFTSLKETMVRQGLLFYPSETYLRSLQQKLRGRVSFFVAMHNGELQGTAVILHNHLGAFYYRGGSIPKPFTGSLNLLQYEAMKELKRKNVPVYDLMGARIETRGDAKIEGIQRFKERFASGMRRGYSFRRVIRPLRHRMFVNAVKAYFFLKGSRYAGDAIDQTRRVRELPNAESTAVAEEAGHVPNRVGNRTTSERQGCLPGQEIAAVE